MLNKALKRLVSALILSFSFAPFFCELSAESLQPLFALPDLQSNELKSPLRCIGNWRFLGEKYTLHLECLENRTMQVRQKSKEKSTIWRGTYTATNTEILFYVSSCIEKQGFAQKSTLKNEVWHLRYEKSKDGLLIKSPLPPALEGDSSLLFNFVR